MPLRIFISYSHKDANDFEDLQTHLRPLTRGEGAIDEWSDRKLRIGDDWRSEIQASIDRCDVAILLVSPHFLASEFIVNEELRPLRERHERGEIDVICVPVSPSALEDDEWLSRFQMIPSPKKPIRKLGRASRDEAYNKIRQHLRSLSVDADGEQASAQSKLTRRTARELPSATDYSKSVFEGQTISLHDMYVARGPYGMSQAGIYGVRFERCRIKGPAVVSLQLGTKMIGCSIGFVADDPDSVVFTSPSKLAVVGVIGLFNCELRDCVIEDIAFFAVGDDYEEIRSIFRGMFEQSQSPGLS